MLWRLRLRTAATTSFSMPKQIAIVGAGVSGLTCGVLFAERGYRVSIFADEIGQQTTSAAAAAIWYPYDAGPADKVIAWALETYKLLVDLGQDAQSGVSMIELRTFSIDPSGRMLVAASIQPARFSLW